MNKSISLSSGNSIPILGFGTWKAKPGEVGKAVAEALKVGYVHLDCAEAYENEKEIGETLSKFLDGSTKRSDGSTISRKDLFVTSKLWNSHWDCVEKAIDNTLKNLQLEYLDLYLVHSPFNFLNRKFEELFPEDETGNNVEGHVPYSEMWKQMEAIVKKGKVKSIGISNWPVVMIRDLLSWATIKPVVNQIEHHPYFQQNDLIDYCKKHNIHITAYSPLGSSQTDLLDNQVVVDIAKAHNVQPAQVLIRYCLDKDLIVIPKSVTPERIKSNADVFNFTLTSQEVDKLNGLEKGPQEGRTCRLDDFWGIRVYA
jgi:diketogulonate reductase-like aldo/keto reductase